MAARLATRQDVALVDQQITALDQRVTALDKRMVERFSFAR
jgi:hypothetical protein